DRRGAARERAGGRPAARRGAHGVGRRAGPHGRRPARAADRRTHGPAGGPGVPGAHAAPAVRVRRLGMSDLRLDGLSATLAGVEIVHALDLHVDSGQVFGLVGPNGSGKSTALRCVYRALRPSAGVVWIDDADVARLSSRDAARRVAALTQDAVADLDLTVADVVALGRVPYQRGNVRLTAHERDLCRGAMERTDVAHLAGRGILSLSGGERQRVLLARALVQEP